MNREHRFVVFDWHCNAGLKIVVSKSRIPTSELGQYQEIGFEIPDTAPQSTFEFRLSHDGAVALSIARITLYRTA